jgi:hypothetical protein
MVTLKKNFRLTFLASLLALGFGGAHAQDSAGDLVAPQTGSAQATTQSGVPGQSAQSLQQHGTNVQSGNAISSGAGANRQTQQATAAQQDPGAAVVYMMVPVEVATAGAPLQRGCWAKMYDAENYAGESLTLAGPTTINDMSGPFGINWDDRVESVQTGPQALLTVFDDEDFEEPVAQFKPGQQVADVSRRMGFFDEFGSIRLVCQRN